MEEEALYEQYISFLKEKYKPSLDANGEAPEKVRKEFLEFRSKFLALYKSAFDTTESFASECTEIADYKLSEVTFALFRYQATLANQYGNKAAARSLLKIVAKVESLDKALLNASAICYRFNRKIDEIRKDFDALSLVGGIKGDEKLSFHKWFHEQSDYLIDELNAVLDKFNQHVDSR